MVEQQIGEKLVIANCQPDLSANKRESLAQLQQELLDVVHELVLQFALIAAVSHCHEVEDVGIAE